MEALISAFLADIVGRAISVVVKKCREQKTTEEDLQRLHQLLLRISAVVEEAEGWGVANQRMICQPSMMREQMMRGYYLLDSFKCTKKKNAHDEVTRSSFAQSKINPAKRFCIISSNSPIESMVIGRANNKELKQFTLVLENTVADMKELVILLMSYPRMVRQPYGAYLYLDKYMFGCQMEREQAISFLLQAEPLRNRKLGVLPIAGPALIVEHVCNDERVRNHFSLVVMYIGNDLEDETATTFRDNCVIKHQNVALDEERSLVVIGLLEDMKRGAWKRLMHSAERCMAHWSKIIITSRSEKTDSLGTTEALRLSSLSKEACWYFFRMLVFGSTDPEEYPGLTSIAMEIACEMGGSFSYANVIATLLRANLSARFWCRVLRHIREHTQKNILLLGEYPLQESEDPHCGRGCFRFGA